MNPYKTSKENNHNKHCCEDIISTANNTRIIYTEMKLHVNKDTGLSRDEPSGDITLFCFLPDSPVL